MDSDIDIGQYCREIETYLCQKNEGHLIRIVGPSFEVVSRWATDGVPLKIACEGIDRSVERYYRKGPRRRPVRIDFCEADVLDVFDEWRRATGLARQGDAIEPAAPSPRGTSLPEHLTRVLARLTQARVAGTLDAPADALIDRLSSELDAARASARGLRGDQRLALIERLAAADAELLRLAKATVSPAIIDALARDAEQELSGFRTKMTPDVFARAHGLAVDRLLRERLRLPTITFG